MGKRVQPKKARKLGLWGLLALSFLGLAFLVVFMHLAFGLYRNYELFELGKVFEGRVIDRTSSLWGSVLQVESMPTKDILEVHWSIAYKSLGPALGERLEIIDVPGRPGLRTAKTFSQLWGVLLRDFGLLIVFLILGHGIRVLD